jgi:hypothetical protein
MYQRLYLTRPLDGTFGKRKVKLIDVSAIGALMENDEGIKVGTRSTLRFEWRGQPVKIKAQAVRTEEGRAGVTFLEDSEILRRLIADSATEMLRAQQANVEGDREHNIVGEDTLTAASAGLRGRGYIMYTFSNGTWSKRRALLPDQPEDGFTISAAEPEDQVALLCDAYERGDEEARRMTRLLAELSTATVRQ